MTNKQCGVTFFRSSNWFQNLLKKILREKINIDTEEKLSFLGFNKYSWRFGGRCEPPNGNLRGRDSEAYRSSEPWLLNG